MEKEPIKFISEKGLAKITAFLREKDEITNDSFRISRKRLIHFLEEIKRNDGKIIIPKFLSTTTKTEILELDEEDFFQESSNE